MFPLSLSFFFFGSWSIPHHVTTRLRILLGTRLAIHRTKTLLEPLHFFLVPLRLEIGWSLAPPDAASLVAARSEVLGQRVVVV